MILWAFIWLVIHQPSPIGWILTQLQFQATCLRLVWCRFLFVFSRITVSHLSWFSWHLWLSMNAGYTKLNMFKTPRYSMALGFVKALGDIASSKIMTRWWFQWFFYLHPYLGKLSNLTFFSDGLKPPTRWPAHHDFDEVLWHLQLRGYMWSGVYWLSSFRRNVSTGSNLTEIVWGSHQYHPCDSYIYRYLPTFGWFLWFSWW